MLSILGVMVVDQNSKFLNLNSSDSVERPELFYVYLRETRDPRNLRQIDRKMERRISNLRHTADNPEWKRRAEQRKNNLGKEWPDNEETPPYRKFKSVVERPSTKMYLF